MKRSWSEAASSLVQRIGLQLALSRAEVDEKLVRHFVTSDDLEPAQDLRRLGVDHNTSGPVAERLRQRVIALRRWIELALEAPRTDLRAQELNWLLQQDIPNAAMRRELIDILFKNFEQWSATGIAELFRSIHHTLTQSDEIEPRLALAPTQPGELVVLGRTAAEVEAKKRVMGIAASKGQFSGAPLDLNGRLQETALQQRPSAKPSALLDYEEVGEIEREAAREHVIANFCFCVLELARMPENQLAAQEDPCVFTVPPSIYNQLSKIQAECQKYAFLNYFAYLPQAVQAFIRVHGKSLASNKESATAIST